MHLKKILPVLAMAAPGAALAQGGGDLPLCEILPEGAETHACFCPAGFQFGYTWGSGPYTADSHICTAALHAGIIGPDGGAVLAMAAEGLEVYPSSTAHGVTTSGWDDSYDLSLAVSVFESPAPPCDTLPDGVETLVCACPDSPARRSVWGSNPYTGDSDICTAAIHAGIIGETGGELQLTRVAGQESYPGSSRNGITTSDWGSYDESIAIAAVASGYPDCGIMSEAVDAAECYCAPDAPSGDVWGVGPFTSDSDICTAARHAGAVGVGGGLVRVLRIRGLGAYSGGSANGETTLDWTDAYDSSIVFDRN